MFSTDSCDGLCFFKLWNATFQRVCSMYFIASPGLARRSWLRLVKKRAMFVREVSGLQWVSQLLVCVFISVQRKGICHPSVSKRSPVMPGSKLYLNRTQPNKGINGSWSSKNEWNAQSAGAVWSRVSWNVPNMGRSNRRRSPFLYCYFKHAWVCFFGFRNNIPHWRLNIWILKLIQNIESKSKENRKQTQQGTNFAKQKCSLIFL